MKLKHPHSGVIVEVAPELGERLVADGWVKIREKKGANGE